VRAATAVGAALVACLIVALVGVTLANLGRIATDEDLAGIW
jgi:hypothetical protein